MSKEPSKIALKAFLGKVESIKIAAEKYCRKLNEELKHDKSYTDVTTVKKLWERYNEAKNWAMHNIYEVGQHMPYVTDDYFYSDRKKGI